MTKAIGLALVGFLALDGVWLGLVAKNLYRDQLSAIARMKDGGLSPIWSAALPVYVLLALGVALFVIPRATDVLSAAKYGALFGLVVYGVYDLTNYSTLAQYSPLITIVDICWGIVASAVCAAGVRALT